MAQRTVCLCEGKYIGIESIFTIVDGKQINIPDKLAELRKLSDEGRLSCPCGCGARLILIAGDRNLREQHFRIKEAFLQEKCQATMEGKTSIDSKIVLKYWMIEKLGVQDVDSRVPISDISDSERKYELTLLSKEKNVAVNYCRDRANLEDEKFDVLEANKGELSIIHVMDISNEEVVGQYPEGVMKVQNRQGYCLFLQIEEREYEKALLKAVYYYKDANGLWNEKLLVKAMLCDYWIGDNGEVLLHGMKLSERAAEVAKACQEQVEADKKRMEEERIRREAEYKQRLVEQEKRREEQRKREQEAERQRLAMEEAKRRAEEERKAEEKKREDEFWKRFPELIEQQIEPVCDPKGNRWYRCKECGVTGMSGKFSSYGGGVGEMNLGTCRECARAKSLSPALPVKEKVEPPKEDSTKCPMCGTPLVERRRKKDGHRFLGCSKFPLCNYTRDQ